MIKEILSNIPLFIDLDESEIDSVSVSCTPRKYPKNSMIILEEEFRYKPETYRIFPYS